VCVILLGGAGCWDRREINDLNVATLLGFDRVAEDGKSGVLLSVLTQKIGAPGTSGAAQMGTGGAPATLGQVVSVEGKNIDDAMRNFTLRSSRQLYLGHVLGIVIGEGMARQDGIEEVIDYVDRDAVARYRTQVAVCDGTALDALQTQPEYENLASTELVGMVEKAPPLVSKAVPATLLQVITELITPGRDVIMPRMHLFTPPELGSVIRKGPPAGIVEIQPDQRGKEGIDGAQGAGSKEDAGVRQTANPEKKTFSLNGSGVFLGDKLAGWLNEDESLGVMLITGQARGGTIPFAFRSSDHNASLFFLQTRTEVKPVIAPDGITFEVHVKGAGKLTEDGKAAIDVTKETDIDAAERLADQEAQHYCQEAVAQCQLLKSDACGFGDLVHHADPAFWKQIRGRWRDYFPTVKVVVQADFTISQAGVTNQAVKPW
jgi:spore germination protein KC